MFQVCQSLKTWPMIALESLLSQGYFLAQLSLFVKSVDMTFSYFATCCTFNLYLTLFGYLQVWIVSLHCGVWKVILSAQWQTLRVLSTISAVQCILSLQGLDFLYLLQRNRYMLFSYCLKIRMYSLKRKILVCCTRWSCTWCLEGLFENSKCLWGSVCCGQLHSLESTLWRSNQQKQINASASVSPLLLFLSKFSGTEVNTYIFISHLDCGDLIFLWMVPLAKEVERTSSNY